MPYRIGCDVGGTFTDLCLVETRSGRSTFVKIPTTAGRQADAVIEATRMALAESGLAASAIEGFAHGTTVATNAVLERKGAPTALLVTKGFRDLLLIARQTRPHLYDAAARRTAPLVPRHLSFEVPERVAASGKITSALDEACVLEIAEHIAQAGVRSVAVVFLHSYANDRHERRVGEILAARLPDADISLSVDILPQPGEYERASTTVINAYVMPPLRAYLQRLTVGLADLGIPEKPTIMQSNGGLMSAAVASSAKSVHTCLSGPAAGLVGARAFAKAAGFRNVVSVDMGGTSFDIGLIRDGSVVTRHEGELEGLPLRVPIFDIITLGAGGGSIARLDEGGLLRVGPESAGAAPGPAAYGRGGILPTVTDANVVLGRLRSGRSLGGGLSIDRAASVAAIRSHIAEPLGLTVEESAAGIIRIVNAAMVRGIRRVTVERGFDPRDFALLAFGGAGPLHAVELAQDLGMGTVIIPPSPGLLCAIGLLLSPWRHDETASLETELGALDPVAFRGTIDRLAERARRQAQGEGIDPAAITLRTHVDLRYAGQGRTMPVSVNGCDLAAAAARFHSDHRRNYGYDRLQHPVEIVAVNIVASSPPPAAALPSSSLLAREPPMIGEAEAMVGGCRLRIPVIDRARLKLNASVDGPALIEQQDTTILLGRQRARIDDVGNLIIEVGR